MISPLARSSTSCSPSATTLLSAVRSRDSFEARSKVRTWLIGILKNKIIDHFRKSSRRPEELVDSEDSESFDRHFNRVGIWSHFLSNWAGNPDSVLEGKGFLKVLESCFSKLPERHRQVFTLVTLDGIEAEEVCKLLKISSSTFWVIMHRARMGLRDCVELNWVKAK